MSGANPPGVPARIGLGAIVEVELNRALPDLGEIPEPAMLVLVRLCDEPVGMLYAERERIAGAENLAATISERLDGELRSRLADHGVDPATPLGPEGYPHQACPYRTSLEAAAADGPPISVVVPTRDGEATLERCLRSVLACHYGDMEVVVVDNASVTDASRWICERLGEEVGAGRVRWVSEPVPGVARARNAGLYAATHDLVAYVDDDERVDANWLAALARELSGNPRLGFASGVILPAELATDAQVRFEQYGGHSKGRGFRRVVFDAPYLRDVQSPMYPLPPFGAAGNLAFRKHALIGVGAFDVVLGAGAPGAGNEETHAISELLLAGWEGVYIPDAITWHPHYREDDGRLTQLSGYAIGLGAYYAALIARNPRRLGALARLAPEAIRYARAGAEETDASEDVSRLERPSMDVRGLIRGPWRYARGRLAARRR